jgi:hypothetical protein
LLNPEKCFGDDTGTCSPAEHRVYQNAVNAACKVKRACKKNITDCSKLFKRLQSNSNCAYQRDLLNLMCYQGGNKSHRDEADIARKTAAECASRMEELGCMCPASQYLR